jgi:hypothetical protein
MFWVFFVVLAFIGICLLWVCFMGASCPTNAFDSWGYAATSPATQNCINNARNSNSDVDRSRKFKSTSNDTFVRGRKKERKSHGYRLIPVETNTTSLV